MVICPVCGWKGRKFLSFGTPIRENVKCPQCFSKERHRYLYLYLKSILPKNKELNILHIAPEESIRKLFLSYPKFNYLSIDISPERLKAMKKEDLTQLSFPNKSFDIIFCSHVLEHIPDDKKALSEIHRVMKDDGFGIIQVPLFDRNKTLENNNYDEGTKLKLFGQKDHLRAYGKDFKKILTNASFNVSVINYLTQLTQKEIEIYRLIHNVDGTPLEGQSQEYIYYCEK